MQHLIKQSTTAERSTLSIPLRPTAGRAPPPFHLPVHCSLLFHRRLTQKTSHEETSLSVWGLSGFGTVECCKSMLWKWFPSLSSARREPGPWQWYTAGSTPPYHQSGCIGGHLNFASRCQRKVKCRPFLRRNAFVTITIIIINHSFTATSHVWVYGRDYNDHAIILFTSVFPMWSIII